MGVVSAVANYLVEFLEKAEVRIRDLKFPLSGYLVKCFARLLSLLYWYSPRTKDEMYARSSIVSFLLREPNSICRKIVRDELTNRKNVVENKNEMVRMNSSSTFEPSRYFWSDECEYSDYLKRHGGSRMLTTIHMGNFWGAYLRIGSVQNGNRSFVAIRKQTETEYESRLLNNFSELGMTYEVHRPQDSPIELVRRIRRKNTTIACMCDLSQSFGETVAVQFFGRTAYFAKGPASIAVMGRIPILPFVTYSSSGVEHIELDNMIDTELRINETLDQCISRVTQELAFFAEKWIRRFPHQWDYMFYSPTFFANPDKLVRLDAF